MAKVHFRRSDEYTSCGRFLGERIRGRLFTTIKAGQTLTAVDDTDQVTCGVCQKEMWNA
jgi:hypothetical protein